MPVVRPDTVVFDIGNVLLQWDPRHLYRQIFADAAEMEHFLAEVCPPAWNEAQDAGRSWAEAEAEAIGRHPKYAAEVRAFRARWQEMVPGPIEGTHLLLERLAARGVPLYAITNFAADTLREAQARFAFLTRFRGLIVSGEVRLLKPDPRIYQALFESFNLDPARCVFIDDSPKNVVAASAVGMHALHFTSAAQFETSLHGFALL